MNSMAWPRQSTAPGRLWTLLNPALGIWLQQRPRLARGTRVSQFIQVHALLRLRTLAKFLFHRQCAVWLLAPG
jgi:hypothetical protein